MLLPSHSSAQNSVVLRIVDGKSSDSLMRFPSLEACCVAETGNGEFFHLDKVQTDELGQSFSPSLSCFVENFHVEPQVASQIIAQIETTCSVKKFLSSFHVLRG